MLNPGKSQALSTWHGIRYPDSELVSLVCRYVPRQGAALVAGCGSGRHVRLLSELGFDAAGVEADADAAAVARSNGLAVTHAMLQDYHADEPLQLVVAWGLMMLPEAGGAKAIAHLDATWIIANWRTAENGFCQTAASGPLRFDSRGIATVNIHSDNHLNGLSYHVFEPQACHFPGYERVTMRHLRLEQDGEINAWYETVHRRSS